MASLSRLIKEKGEELGGIKTEQVKVQQLHYSKLKGSPMNFYAIDDDSVRELADNMLIVGGILEPLIVRKTDLSEYEILAGHKRKAASLYNVERGYPQYEFLPCIVIDVGGLMSRKISEKVILEAGENGNEKLLDMIAEYIVICTNSTAREISPYEKMMQSVRLSEILPAMLEDSDLKGRALRAEVAKEMKCGDGQVGRYQAIYNKLTPDAMRLFKQNAIPVTIAYGMSGLSEERQQELLTKRDNITSDEIERLKELEKEEKESQRYCEGQITLADEAVSKTDTDYVKEFNPSDYSKVAWSEELLQTVFDLVFDDKKFPSDVMDELLKKENREAEYFKRIMCDILPFETDKIRLEFELCFKAYFKERMICAELPLWPLWTRFADRYGVFKSKNNNIVNDEGENNNIVSGGGEETRFKVVNSRGYCKDDVELLLVKYRNMVKAVEANTKQNASKGDIETLKKARVLRDALLCLLDKYDEMERLLDSKGN